MSNATAAEGATLLVVPSFNADPRTLAGIAGLESWPERQLIDLRALQQPDLNCIVITPVPLSAICLEAVLELMPAMPTQLLRSRVQCISLNDRSLQGLSEKLLARPQLLDQLQKCLGPGSWLSAYAIGPAEEALAARLDLRFEGTPSALAYWGSKSGSAALFQELGLPHPRTTGLCRSLAELAEALEELLLDHPAIQAVVVKLNRMAGGRGNAPLPLDPGRWRQLSKGRRRAELLLAIEQLAMPLPHWRDELLSQGAIAQELITGERLHSPSVQLSIRSEGEVELISTHEQCLGGLHRQSFEGCCFPARSCYRQALMAAGRQVGQALAAKGCRGPVLIDWLAERLPSGWRLWGMEINLRKGGTTHPFQLAAMATGAQLDADTGDLLSRDGHPIVYEACDSWSMPQWQGLLPEQWLEAVVQRQLYFNPTERRGCIPHRLGALSEHGLLGVTAIGRSRRDAAWQMRQLQTVASALQS